MMEHSPDQRATNMSSSAEDLARSQVLMLPRALLTWHLTTQTSSFGGLFSDGGSHVAGSWTRVASEVTLAVTVDVRRGFIEAFAALRAGWGDTDGCGGGVVVVS